MEAILGLHNLGLVMDVDAGSFVEDNEGKIRVVGLASAREHDSHACDLRTELLKAWTLCPKKEKLGCTNVYAAAEFLDIFVECRL